ncbi:hypothetical protein [uncultured Friedmanniella sp.]|uniref:hypothetical protein n=1 Tax=uncultured Friedmanniella sp. TaxID=335381 RepID=UPI0035C9861A
MATFSPYEHDEARKIVERKHEDAVRPRNRLSRVAQETGQKAVEGVRKIPYADRAIDLGAGAYEQAVEGLGKALSTTALLTLSNKRLIKKFARRDASVTTMEDIRALDLKVIDAVRP